MSRSAQAAKVFITAQSVLIVLLLAVLIAGGIYKFVLHGGEAPHENDSSAEKKPGPDLTRTVRPSEGVFKASTFRLSNGMEAVVIENHRAPAVTHMVWYKAGAADEPYGVSGAAHVLEHMMFRGSENVAPGEFSRAVRRRGGRDNAFTAQDYTAYFQTVAVKDLEDMMRMEADRMARLTLDEALFEAEKNVVIEERRQVVENNPKGRFFENLRNALFPHHAYGSPVIGWMREVKALTLADMEAFYKRWYAPNNAVLVVSGAVDPEEVRVMAERHYGTIPYNENVPDRQKTRPESIRFEGVRKVLQKHPQIRQPTLYIGWRVPSYAQDREQALALEVLADVLGGRTGRLYTRFVVEESWAVSADLYYSGESLNDGQLWLSITPAPQSDIALLRSRLETFFGKLHEESPISGREIKVSVDRLQAESAYARDSLTGPAMIVGRSLSTGQSLESVQSWPQDLEGVTQQQVQDLAGRLFDSDRGIVRVEGEITGQEDGS